ncbi:phosphomevalonate kinase [Blastomyces dermatitidis ER-3]|uniref:Phosphomevalonate kinase n=1 Tax=Ajellomyces dermatitidis (strain ER-3 / ATCC MYA-2586) TaxID=559297 RepID=A0ABP2EKV9_AJEDR|nr:phosphomevalonate kinase [Blastomyces dermatitidis ER-3]EEQ83228.1 phosphomevalonate kinase [Blastomyces dermatitidis ER-3]
MNGSLRAGKGPVDGAYTGTVFALNARIHVVVRQLRREKRRREERVTRAARRGDEEEEGRGGGGGGRVEDGAGEEGRGGDGKGEDKVEDGGVGKGPGEGDGDADGGRGEEEEVIVVKSPQFVDAVWEYGVRREPDGGGVRVVQKGDCPRNPFVETSLNYALTYISYVAASKLFGSLSITILADNDYYSQTSISQAAGANRGTRFVNFGVKLHEAHKTGLGSSAALVTALVSAMVIHRTVQPEELPTVRDKLHNLAQAAHCAAQGKVGSGFDVGAAVYGSCLYRRFSPAVLGSLGDVGSPQFEERLFAVVEDLNTEHPWDTECVDFGTKLPRGMQMVLCDVDCGSQTPGMVKKVLQWREENREEANALWAELQQNNEKLRLLLKDLLYHTNSTSRTTTAVSSSPSSASAGNSTNISSINDDDDDDDDDNDGNNFDAVSRLISRSRALLRTMTQKSAVPIEPRVQTELLDRLSAEVEGVIGGVVPGAGGYDAIALLVRDDAAVVDRLRGFLRTWKSSVEDDFGGKIERVRLLGVAHGSEGLRNEIPAQYSGWMS